MSKKYVDPEILKSRFMNGCDDYFPLWKIEMVIDDAPAADVEEVRHGHWIITEYEYYDCSECGESYFNGCDSRAEAERRLEIHQDVYDRCPYCGAKMDEKRNEDG